MLKFTFITLPRALLPSTFAWNSTFKTFPSTCHLQILLSHITLNICLNILHWTFVWNHYLEHFPEIITCEINHHLEHSPQKFRVRPVNRISCNSSYESLEKIKEVIAIWKYNHGLFSFNQIPSASRWRRSIDLELSRWRFCGLAPPHPPSLLFFQWALGFWQPR